MTRHKMKKTSAYRWKEGNKNFVEYSKKKNQKVGEKTKGNTFFGGGGGE